jgi:hypothetical protein
VLNLTEFRGQVSSKERFGQQPVKKERKTNSVKCKVLSVKQKRNHSVKCVEC